MNKNKKVLGMLLGAAFLLIVAAVLCFFFRLRYSSTEPIDSSVETLFESETEEAPDETDEAVDEAKGMVSIDLELPCWVLREDGYTESTFSIQIRSTEPVYEGRTSGFEGTVCVAEYPLQLEEQEGLSISCTPGIGLRNGWYILELIPSYSEKVRLEDGTYYRYTKPAPVQYYVFIPKDEPEKAIVGILGEEVPRTNGELFNVCAVCGFESPEEAREYALQLGRSAELPFPTGLALGMTAAAFDPEGEYIGTTTLRMDGEWFWPELRFTGYITADCAPYTTREGVEEQDFKLVQHSSLQEGVLWALESFGAGTSMHVGMYQIFTTEELSEFVLLMQGYQFNGGVIVAPAETEAEAMAILERFGLELEQLKWN